ncbi:MAG: cache domain-containing protein [Spirochaetales bacterium]|nr:cache domain-containing protein [Spirochaetales bacterium]
MTIEEHAENSYRRTGLRAEDIHRWIDNYFDSHAFQESVNGSNKDYNPYEHRRHRHCREAMINAIEEFQNHYDKDKIAAVFESHLKDDYQGYIPIQSDFDNPDFIARYHLPEHAAIEDNVLSRTELKEYFYSRKNKALLPGKSFAWRIIIPSLVLLVLFLGSLYIVIEPVIRSIIMNGKKEMLIELISSGTSAIQYYQELEKAGILSGEEARKSAADELSKLRYGKENKDYFWIIDTGPRMIMHPYRQELVGRDLRDYNDKEDKSGKNLFVEALEITEQKKEGFLTYLWQWMDNPDKTALKLSYVKRIDHWDWILGTGVYIDDVEIEMDKITNQLLLADVTVSLISIIILISVVAYSAKLEKLRLQAESGLLEARDRYKALVRVSGEGKALVMKDKIIYSNPALCRFTDINEEQLLETPPPVLISNWKDLQSASENESGNIKSETNILKSDGTRFPAKISINRVFFSKEQGFALSIQPIAIGIDQILSKGHSFSGTKESWHTLLNLMEEAENPERVFDIYGQCLLSIKTQIQEAASAPQIRNKISSLWYTLAGRLCALAIKRLGKAPRDYSFLALGSNARREMTLFSDQDNALVYQGQENDSVKQWFLGFSTEICDQLERAGYPKCPGGINASHAKWCLSEEEFYHSLKQRISKGTGDDLLIVSTLCDLALVYGSQQMMEKSYDFFLTLLANSPSFLGLWAEHIRNIRVPREAFNAISKAHQEKTLLNVKECLKILENFARLYAAKYKVPTAGSINRIDLLGQLNIFDREFQSEFIYIFNELWELRLKGQLYAWEILEKPSDNIILQDLPPTFLKNLKNILNGISSFSNRISSDFFGGIQ